jgi:hypothetical protein
VKQTFNLEDSQAILALPIVDDSLDFLSWHFDSRGIFSVKSACKLCIDIVNCPDRSGVNPNSDQHTWKAVWKLECPPKVQHFLWRFGHNSHPLRMNIERRGVELDTWCTVCSKYFENGGHMYLSCKEVKKRWCFLGMEDIRVRLCDCSYPLEVLRLLLSLPKEQCMIGVAFLWCWWQERNKANHQERRLSEEEFSFLVKRHTDEWKSFLKKAPASPCCDKKHWKPPPMDRIKINIDGAFHEDRGMGGWGAIARDSVGEPIFAAAGRVNTAADALHTELMALVHAIPFAEQQGIGRPIFSTDCLVLKQAMESSSYDLSRLGPLFLHAKYLLRISFDCYSFEFVPRACNKPAHALAALGVENDLYNYVVWLDSLPPDVNCLVADDYVVP